MALRSVRIHKVKSLLRGFKGGDEKWLKANEREMEREAIFRSLNNPKEVGPAYSARGDRQLTTKEHRLKDEAVTRSLLRRYRLLSKDQSEASDFSSKQTFKKQPAQDAKKLVKHKKKLHFTPQKVITMGAYR